MKAILLAAGKGTRLRPITDGMPKCLIPINGKPLLYYWFTLFKKHGISEVLINLHHFANQVNEYVAKSEFSLDITLAYEEKLLGSAGTIKANSQFIKNERDFFILYADNCTNVDLQHILEFHRSHNALLTMGLFTTDTPRACGIAEVDQTGLITSFVEKSEFPPSNLANAGIFVAAPSILQYFPSKDFIDLGYDVLPNLIGKAYGYPILEYLLDIGTLRNYEQAQSDARLLQF
jgi:mannose-1-phosphate guanylyltransferase